MLVVDDDLELLRVLEDAVELLGHTPRIARNTEQAIALLETLPPCLVLLDSIAPSDSGEDFRAALRRRRYADQFRVALMSGCHAARAWSAFRSSPPCSSFVSISRAAGQHA